MIDPAHPGRGRGQAIVTVGVVTSEVVTNAFKAIRKGGTVVVTGLSDPTKTTIELSGATSPCSRSASRGACSVPATLFHDIREWWSFTRPVTCKLDELITATYTLDQINQGYQDLLDGKNIRGVILHDGT